MTNLEQRAVAFLRGGPCTALELALELGVAHGTAKHVIEGLRASGHVGTQSVSHRGVPGRPAAIYALSEQAGS